MRQTAPLSVICLLLTSPLVAAAHLELIEPPSRYGAAVLKDGPCGRMGGERSDTITVLESGAVLDVVWSEYIDHPGHFRVAFDADGDDDFRDPICLSGCETRSPQIQLNGDRSVLLDGIPDARGGRTTLSVRLPDVECQRCALQVIQVMYDKPPYVIPGNDIYYHRQNLKARPPVKPGSW